MLTVIDGRGESLSHPRPIQINNAGLVDISTTNASLPAEQQDFEAAAKDLNHSGKIMLYKGLQKELANCLQSSSRLLMKKNELRMEGDKKGAETIGTDYKIICNRQRLILQQIKTLYDMLRSK